MKMRMGKADMRIIRTLTLWKYLGLRMSLSGSCKQRTMSWKGQPRLPRARVSASGRLTMTQTAIRLKGAW